MVRTIKVSEQMRKEYRILPAVIMDAIDEGVERGKSLDLAKGEARGSRQAKLETAKNLLNFGLSGRILQKQPDYLGQKWKQYNNFTCDMCISQIPILLKSPPSMAVLKGLSRENRTCSTFIRAEGLIPRRLRRGC